MMIDFIDDEEKMRDFPILTKEEFLASYSYLTEEEYDATKELYEQMKENDGRFISNTDIEMIKIKYENAKYMSKEYQRQANPECRYEYGKAEMLEYILRVIGFDYTDVASGRFLANAN